ncbi:hypothetical protein [Agromyces aureus]|uniref:Uncharacterized protein n=1 Tax=Agromyces aureus TaxID=453304 RepID=A0A191WEX0_9MICO|nr:hypothetical protein [Agromyces aureus]ANJ26806.1 hypothetical protein ATC03_08840 [Agromyces aureus]
MSAETLAGVAEAIREHVADTLGPEYILTDWFIGYATMYHEPDADEGIGFTHSYATSSTAPHAVLGVAQLATASLEGDLFGDGE